MQLVQNAGNVLVALLENALRGRGVGLRAVRRGMGREYEAGSHAGSTRLIRPPLGHYTRSVRLMRQ